MMGSGWWWDGGVVPFHRERGSGRGDGTATVPIFGMCDRGDVAHLEEGKRPKIPFTGTPEHRLSPSPLWDHRGLAGAPSPSSSEE